MKYGMSGIKFKQPSGSFHNKLKSKFMICRGWCRSNDVEILKTSQQQDDRVIARLGFLKILCKLEAFFSMAQILEIQMEKYIFCDFVVLSLQFHCYWFPWLIKACM